MDNSKKTFEGKFPHIEGMRCPRCDLPVVDTPYTRVVYACAGCGRSFVREEGKMITIEKYLDPEDIFRFENYARLSPTFQNLLREERNRYKMNTPMNQMGIVVDHLERYRGWAEHGFKCMQSNQIEEAIYSMVMALHDDQSNPGFWLNIAQMVTNFHMTEIADRAIAIAEKLDPNYESLPRTIGRIKAYRQNWERQNRGLSEKQKKSGSIQSIAEDGLRNGNFPRALIRLKQSVAIDQNNQMAWNNYASLSLQAGDISEGKYALKRSLAINPRNPNVHYIHMNLYIAQDNFPMAIQKVKDALALDPRNPRFQAKLRELENAFISAESTQIISNRTKPVTYSEYTEHINKISQQIKPERRESTSDVFVKECLRCFLFGIGIFIFLLIITSI